MDLVVVVVVAIVAYSMGVRQGIKRQMALIQQWVIAKHAHYEAEIERLDQLYGKEDDEREKEEISRLTGNYIGIKWFLETEAERDMF